MIIFKEASAGYENAEPVVLQGHLDMVCVKDADAVIDLSLIHIWETAQYPGGMPRRIPSL